LEKKKTVREKKASTLFEKGNNFLVGGPKTHLVPPKPINKKGHLLLFPGGLPTRPAGRRQAKRGEKSKKGPRSTKWGHKTKYDGKTKGGQKKKKKKPSKKKGTAFLGGGKKLGPRGVRKQGGLSSPEMGRFDKKT